MQVKLRVIGGKNDGREIKLSVPRFVIGRGEEAHLRPSSDLVSREHCVIKLENGSVVVADLASRNGTFVNGQQLAEPYVAKAGDTLRIGRLQFEIVIDHVQPSNKRPRINGVADAAARTMAGAASQGDFSEDSITDWLSSVPEDDLDSKAMQETQHFSLEDTPTKLFIRSDEGSDSDSVDASEPGDEKSKKRGPRKLPNRPKAKAESSKSAADDVLRRFFNRR